MADGIVPIWDRVQEPGGLPEGVEQGEELQYLPYSLGTVELASGISPSNLSDDGGLKVVLATGHIVGFVGSYRVDNGDVGMSKVVGTLPEGFRPLFPVHLVCVMETNLGLSVCTVRLLSNGEIKMNVDSYNPNISSCLVHINGLCYSIADTQFAYEHDF